MQQLFGFLRAINVGGRTMKMDDLRLAFEGLGFQNVQTFIASGNVIFETQEADFYALENRITNGVEAALGFQTTIFLRTFPDLSRITACQPFESEQFARATAFNIAFLNKTPGGEAINRLMGHRNEIDDFAVIGQEVYWLSQVRQSQSKFSNAVLEKVLGQPSTMRQMTTINKLVQKYS